jgi:hypothetical protein
MKNVTISMEEPTLAWVRVEAAKAGQSVSRWIGERLQELTRAAAEADDDMAAMQTFLAHPGWDLDLAHHPFNREEIYDERLRGLERGDLRLRPDRSDQARRREGVAEPARRFQGPDDERPGSK